MIFIAQIDPVTQQLTQGLGFSTSEMAAAHMEIYVTSFYVSVDEFVSPMTHVYINGLVSRKASQ